MSDFKILNLLQDNKNKYYIAVKEIARDIDNLDYIDIVKFTFNFLNTCNVRSVVGCEFDIDKIVQINNGDYKGDIIYVIPLARYQLSITDHYYTHNYYGSCSWCDVLESIKHYERTECEKLDELYKISIDLLFHLQKFKISENS